MFLAAIPFHQRSSVRFRICILPALVASYVFLVLPKQPSYVFFLTVLPAIIGIKSTQVARPVQPMKPMQPKQRTEAKTGLI